MLLLVLGAGLRGSLPVSAEESLGRGVPADALLYLHYRSDPQGALVTRLQGFREALGRIGFLEELRRRLQQASSQALDEVKEQASKEPTRKAREPLQLQARRIENDIRRLDLDIAQWQKILARVEWWKLVSNEVVLAGRREGERIAILILFKVGGAEQRARLQELSVVLYGLGAIIPDQEIISSVRGGVEVTVLQNFLDPQEEICLTGSNDVVLLASSRQLLRQSLQLLAGEGRELGYVHTAEHAKALAGLQGSPTLLHGGKLSVDGFQLMAKPGELFGDSSVLMGFESFAAAGDLQGNEATYAYRAQFKSGQGAESGLVLRRAFLEQPGVADFARFVPLHVQAFEVSSGSGPQAFLEFLEEIAKESFPNGQDLMDKLESQARAWYAPLKEDFLPLLTGRRTVLSLDDALVILWEIKNDRVSEAQARWNEIVPRLPKELPFKLGVAGARFTLSTSDRALEAALETSTGAASSIAQSSEFQQSWKSPPGELQAVSQGECTTALSWLRRGLELLPLLGRLPPGREEEPILQSLLDAAPRFGEALGALDFLGAYAAYTLREEGAFVGAGRVRLKPPVRGF